jgi:hypothetical protein
MGKVYAKAIAANPDATWVAVADAFPQAAKNLASAYKHISRINLRWATGASAPPRGVKAGLSRPAWVPHQVARRLRDNAKTQSFGNCLRTVGGIEFAH